MSRAWLVACGLVSLFGQVLLLRELAVAFYGSELVIIIALGLWLLWTAAGAAFGRRRFRPAPAHVVRLLLAVAVVLPASVAAIRGIRRLAGGVPGAYLSFPVQLASLALLALPVAVAMGLLFQWAARLHVARGRTLAGAYGLESCGALVGGLAATASLAWGMATWTATLTCALLAAAAALAGHRGATRADHVAAGVVVALLLALLAGEAVTGGGLDRAMTRWNHPDLVVMRDSPYGRVTVERRAGQVVVFENGALSYESEGTAAEEFVHLAALQRARPETVLVLGGAVEGLAAEALRHPSVRRVDLVELDRVLLAVVRDHLPPAQRAVLDDPAVRVDVADPRRVLARRGGYDLILVGLPEPTSGQSNRYYTREFFALARAALRPRGVLAFRLRTAENLWTPRQTRRAASIHRALAAEFADVVVLPGATSTVLASAAPLTREPDALAARLLARDLDARLISPPYLRYLYTNDRFAAVAERLATARAPVNRDRRPICYQDTLLLWLARFFPVLSWLELPAVSWGGLVRTPVAWVAAGLVVGAGIVCRRRRRCRAVLLVGMAGVVGMILETVLLLHYQVVHGVLFQDLGLLLTVFMAGLAGGALLADRLAGDAGLPRRWGWLCAVGTAGVGLLVGLWVRFGPLAGGAPAGVGRLAASLLLLASGFAVAALFAYAGLRERADQQAVVAPLYAADLVGGCLGSLAASLFLVPVLGLPASAVLAAVLAVFALIFI